MLIKIIPLKAFNNMYFLLNQLIDDKCLACKTATGVLLQKSLIYCPDENLWRAHQTKKLWVAHQTCTLCSFCSPCSPCSHLIHSHLVHMVHNVHLVHMVHLVHLVILVHIKGPSDIELWRAGTLNMKQRHLYLSFFE